LPLPPNILNQKTTHKRPLWNLFPVYIAWQLKQRKSIDHTYENLIDSINLSILLNTNSFAEGLLKEITLAKFDSKKSQILRQTQQQLPRTENNRNYANSILENIEEAIKKNTWSQLKKDYELITGQKINSIVDSQVNETINHQFILRNLISHSNSIELSFSLNNEDAKSVEFSRSYDKIYDFLERKKVILKITEQKPVITQIFNCNIADLFVKNSIIFFDQILDNTELPKNNYVSMVYDKTMASLKNIYAI
jgi:hypothetical protein